MSSVAMVFHKKNTQSPRRAFRNGRLGQSLFGSVWHGVERYLEGRSETSAAALGFNCSMVKINKVFRNRQAQAEAAELTANGWVGLFKRREDRNKALAFNSNAVVCDLKTKVPVAVIVGTNSNLSARWCELHSVVNQIPKYLLKTDGVGPDMMPLSVQFGENSDFL